MANVQQAPCPIVRPAPRSHAGKPSWPPPRPASRQWSDLRTSNGREPTQHHPPPSQNLAGRVAPAFAATTTTPAAVADVGLKDAPLRSLFPPENPPPVPDAPKLKVAIVGSGLAGLSTAVELLDQGYTVDIYESRPFLGGKVASWTVGDNHVEMGLHVFFGCYFNLFRLMAKCGVLQNLLLKDHTHTFCNTGGDVRELDFRFFVGETKIGAPFHGLKAFFTTPQLSPLDKVANSLALGTSPIVRSLIDPEGGMRDIRALDGVSFADWFKSHGGSQASIDRMWDPIAYALGFLDCKDISARCMLTIFQFFATKTDASALRMLNGSPAERLLKPITDYIEARGGRIHIRTGCREILYADRPDGSAEVTGLRLTKAGVEQVVTADAYVAALDVPGAKRLLPAAWRRFDLFDKIHALVGVPVITVQLRYDGWVTEMQDPAKVKDLAKAREESYGWLVGKAGAALHAQPPTLPYARLPPTHPNPSLGPRPGQPAVLGRCRLFVLCRPGPDVARRVLQARPGVADAVRAYACRPIHAPAQRSDRGQGARAGIQTIPVGCRPDPHLALGRQGGPVPVSRSARHGRVPPRPGDAGEPHVFGGVVHQARLHRQHGGGHPIGAALRGQSAGRRVGAGGGNRPCARAGGCSGVSWVAGLDVWGGVGAVRARPKGSPWLRAGSVCVISFANNDEQRGGVLARPLPLTLPHRPPDSARLPIVA